MSIRDIARGVAAVAALGAIAYAGFTAGGSGARWEAQVNTGATTIQLGAFQYEVTRDPTPQFGRYDDVTTPSGTSVPEIVKDPEAQQPETHPMQPGDVVVYSYPIEVDIPQGMQAQLACDATTGFRSDYKTGIRDAGGKHDVPMLATAITADGTTPGVPATGNASSAAADFNGPASAGVSVVFTYPNDPAFPVEVLKTPPDVIKKGAKPTEYPVADHKPVTAVGNGTPVDPIAANISVKCSLDRVS